MKKESKVTPWEVSGDLDYKRIIDEFGIKPINLRDLPDTLSEDILFRRGVIFAHRDFGKIISDIKEGNEFAMMTGLMPSGKFHLGHMIVARQMILYQNFGAKLYVAVADLEAYSTRQKSLEELKKIAIDQYLVNYIALGLKPKNCDFYFQSSRSKNAKKSNAYYRLASELSRYATFNEFKAVYGEISPAKMNSSLIQSSDMLHPQLPEFEGNPLNVVIPVGIDQDPHIRIARDIAKRHKDYKFNQISSTYHTFLPSLKGGGKMSSSDENSFIAMTDTLSEVKNKINKYAFSGGRDTLEEHRKFGGNPDIDVSFQYLKYFFEDNDKKLEKIYEGYKSGSLTTGELKEYTIDKINDFLKKHQEKRKKAESQVSKFVSF